MAVLEPDQGFFFEEQPEQINLSAEACFQREAAYRMIDNTKDVLALQAYAKLVVNAFYTQKAATEWAMRQTLGAPSKFAPNRQPQAEPVYSESWQAKIAS